MTALQDDPAKLHTLTQVPKRPAFSFDFFFQFSMATHMLPVHFPYLRTLIFG
jgi:hypothetical protein